MKYLGSRRQKPRLMTEFCTKSKTGFSRVWIWCGPIWAVKRFVWLVIRLLVWVAF